MTVLSTDNSFIKIAMVVIVMLFLGGVILFGDGPGFWTRALVLTLLLIGGSWGMKFIWNSTAKLSYDDTQLLIAYPKEKVHVPLECIFEIERTSGHFTMMGMRYEEYRIGFELPDSDRNEVLFYLSNWENLDDFTARVARKSPYFKNETPSA